MWNIPSAGLIAPPPVRNFARADLHARVNMRRCRGDLKPSPEPKLSLSHGGSGLRFESHHGFDVQHRFLSQAGEAPRQGRSRTTNRSSTRSTLCCAGIAFTASPACCNSSTPYRGSRRVKARSRILTEVAKSGLASFPRRAEGVWRRSLTRPAQLSPARHHLGARFSDQGRHYLPFGGAPCRHDPRLWRTPLPPRRTPP